MCEFLFSFRKKNLKILLAIFPKSFQSLFIFSTYLTSVSVVLCGRLFSLYYGLFDIENANFVLSNQRMDLDKGITYLNLTFGCLPSTSPWRKDIYSVC